MKEDVAGKRPRPRLAAFFDLGHSAACDGFDNLLPLAEERAGAEQMAEAVKWAARRFYSMKSSRKKRYHNLCKKLHIWMIKMNYASISSTEPGGRAMTASGML